jgi:hypothetical protein
MLVFIEIFGINPIDAAKINLGGVVWLLNAGGPVVSYMHQHALSY